MEEGRTGLGDFGLLLRVACFCNAAHMTFFLVKTYHRIAIVEPFDNLLINDDDNDI